jgi:2-methylaconitate cis-trans-isomerase PrpF
MRQHRLPASYYRGGTSRAIIFNAADLPQPPPGAISHPLWADIFRSCIGSPDPNGRQLDGMGGGISSLSKVCVIGPARTNQEHADVDYTFAAIGVKDDDVDYSSNCGNMTAAVGPWAWEHGVGVNRSADENECRVLRTKEVRIRNTNTGKIIRSIFNVYNEEAVVDGDMNIAGVAGAGSPIQLDFLNPAGSKTGKLLPTGNVINEIDGVPVTCMDAGNPCVFVQAKDVESPSFIMPQDVDKDERLRSKLENIRRKAGVMMGLSEVIKDVPGSIPKICMVSKPETHTLLSGEELKEENFDLLSRSMSVGQAHRALPITVALCLAVAAQTQGSVVHECLSESQADKKGITIGHPSGTIVVGSKFNDQGEVLQATLFRTARKLFEGMVFWKGSANDTYSKYLEEQKQQE